MQLVFIECQAEDYRSSYIETKLQTTSFYLI